VKDKKMSDLNDALKPTILVVDDTPANLTLMSALLKDDYKVKLANSGERGLAIAFSDSPPDLILLDIMMPEMDGYEVCTRLKKLKEAADFLRDKTEYLDAEVRRRTAEIIAIQDVTIQIVTSLAETRDPETGNHIRRTQFYVKALAEKLKTHPRFLHDLTAHNIETFYKSAPLHDIGKVGIPDKILLKPGKFEGNEFEIMKNHARLGFEAIEQAEHQLGIKVDFLNAAKDIALSHHEKWDGSGYPQGLVGDKIPLSARLMAVADVYDALISRRVYKQGMPHEKAISIIKEGRGTHFDPDIVDAFLEIEAQVIGIAEKYADTDEDIAKKASHFEIAITQ
jgi:putative two-component system response regulator